MIVLLLRWNENKPLAARTLEATSAQAMVLSEIPLVDVSMESWPPMAFRVFQGLRFMAYFKLSSQDSLLVGGWPIPLKNMSQMGWLFPIYGENKKCSKPPISLIFSLISMLLLANQYGIISTLGVLATRNDVMRMRTVPTWNSDKTCCNKSRSSAADGYNIQLLQLYPT